MNKIGDTYIQNATKQFTNDCAPRTTIFRMNVSRPTSFNSKWMHLAHVQCAFCLVVITSLTVYCFAVYLSPCLYGRKMNYRISMASSNDNVSPVSSSLK